MNNVADLSNATFSSLLFFFLSFFVQQSRHNAEDFDLFTLDDVDAAFDKIIQLKYSQTVTLKGNNCCIVCLLKKLCLIFKEALHWRDKSIWKCRKCADIFICLPELLILSIFIQNKYGGCCFSSVFSSSGLSHVGSLFSEEEQKKFGPWRVWGLSCHTFRCCLLCYWYRLSL